MSGIIDFLILEVVVLIKLKISDLLISSEINDDSLLISNITLLIVSSKTLNSYSYLMFKIVRVNDMGISVCNSSKKVNSIDIELKKQIEKDQKYFNEKKKIKKEENAKI